MGDPPPPGVADHSHVIRSPPLPRAVNILGASNIRFTNCNFGVNYADNMGGAVKTVGSNVTFSTTAFYQNRVRAVLGWVGVGGVGLRVNTVGRWSGRLCKCKLPAARC